MISFPKGVVAGLAIVLASAQVHGDDVSFTPQGRVADMESRLKSLFVSVDFNNATIEQATQALVVLSRQADTNHQGVQFVLQPEAEKAAKPVTLQLNHVPLGETIRYVCELGRVKYKVGDRFVTIVPLVGEDGLVKRTFHVDPGFVEAAQSAGAIPSAKTP